MPLHHPINTYAGLEYCLDTRAKTDGGQRWYHPQPDESITYQ